MKILKQNIKNKNSSPHNIESILTLDFNNEYQGIKENDLKIGNTNFKIALNTTDTYKISRLYHAILGTYQYSKSEAFILSISILLVSEIIQKDCFKIMESIGIL